MNLIRNNGNLYRAPIGNGMLPLSGMTTEPLLPIYDSSVLTDLIQAKTPMRSNSGLTFAFPVSRKRSRERDATITPNLSHNGCGAFTFLGEDISFQIQQQQLDVDRFIARHTQKVRYEIEEWRKRDSRRIIAVVEEGMTKKLRAKEEEIEKIGKLNWALGERVKSLLIENQILRDLAQANEATANTLRRNIEQILTEQQRHSSVALMEDAESCCCSKLEGGEKNVVDGRRRWCSSCGKEESCVLVLPCRHLCLCSLCSSSVHTCPICRSAKTASLHVDIDVS